MTERKDVIVKVPAAIWPDPDKQLSQTDLLQAEIAQLRHDLLVQRTTLHTITRFAVCLMHVLMENSGHHEIRVDSRLYQRMEGAEIQIAQPDSPGGDIYGRFIEKPHYIDLPVGGLR